MASVIAVEQRDGSSPIQIEIEEIPADNSPGRTGGIYDGKTRGARDKVVELAKPLFSEALDLIGSCAEAVHSRFSALPQDKRPQEVEMQFAVKLDATIGAKIVETTAGAQLQVVLRWKAGDDAPDNQQPAS